MFSKQATDKLDEVFTTMFKTSTQTGDAQRGHKLHGDAPAIVSVSPATLPAGTTPAQIVITGTRFVQESVVRVNGSPRPGTLDGGRLTVTLTEEDVRVAGRCRSASRIPTDRPRRRSRSRSRRPMDSEAGNAGAQARDGCGRRDSVRAGPATAASKVCASSANAGVGPFHCRASTVSNSGRSRRSVASVRNR